MSFYGNLVQPISLEESIDITLAELNNNIFDDFSEIALLESFFSSAIEKIKKALDKLWEAIKKIIRFIKEKLKSFRKQKIQKVTEIEKEIKSSNSSNTHKEDEKSNSNIVNDTDTYEEPIKKEEKEIIIKYYDITNFFAGFSNLISNLKWVPSTLGLMALRYDEPDSISSFKKDIKNVEEKFKTIEDIISTDFESNFRIKSTDDINLYIKEIKKSNDEFEELLDPDDNICTKIAEESIKFIESARKGINKVQESNLVDPKDSINNMNKMISIVSQINSKSKVLMEKLTSMSNENTKAYLKLLQLSQKID